MSNQEEVSRADAELARALSQLRPAAAPIDLASVALGRVQRRAARQVRTWRSAAAVLLCGLVRVDRVRDVPRAGTGDGV